MFCPQCGSQNDTLRFCKSCGLSLEAVRHATAMRKPDDKFERGVTPENKRYAEIKAGVIASSVGVGVMIFLYFLMQGIILSGENPPSDAAILSRIWLAGIIPFFVGFALIVNGSFVSKRQLETARRGSTAGEHVLKTEGEAPMLRPADTTEFITPRFGVTEGTTKHLSNQSQKH